MEKSKVAKTKEVILSSAKKVFLTHGYKETTVKMIALEAGFGYGTIYSHFKNGKEDLLAELMIDIMAPFYDIAQLVYTPRNKEQAYEFTYKNIYNYLTLAIDNKELFKVIFEAKGMSNLIYNKWEYITGEFIKRISTNVEIVRGLGLIRNENYHPEIVAGALYYLGERYLWKLILGTTSIPVDEIARDIATMYTHGLFK